MKGLIYTASHLYGLGGGARAVIAIAQAMSQFLPTEIATTQPVPPQVREWLGNIPLIPYRRGMGKDYDVLWSVDHFSYADPLAKRNLAYIFHPHANNTPPPEYELFAVSDYTRGHVESAWGTPCETLYLPIALERMACRKEKMILNVSRFASPNEFADKGHLAMLDAFRALYNAGLKDWQLVFIGSLDPGHGQFLDLLMQQARGYPVRFLVNAEQETVTSFYHRAALYWHATGVNSPEIPGAQEHYGLAIAEAQVAGAVPLAFDSGGHPEIVRHGYDGLLFKTPQELYNMTQHLASHWSAWSLLSQRAQVSAQTWLDQAAFAGRMSDVLNGQPITPPQKAQWLTGDPGQEQVCAVIPVYNQFAMTERCLQKLWQYNPLVKVILVDNASTDQTPSLQAEIEAKGGVYVRREVNDGFAAANMAAAPYCDRPFVLLYNNDVEPLEEDQGEWLTALLLEMEDPSVGVVGPKLLFPTRQVQFGGMGFRPESPHFYHHGYGQADHPAYNQRQDTEAVTGACLLVRRELFEMDTTFALNYEDVDLCLSAKEKGFRVIYQPAAALIHYEARTKKSLPDAAERILASAEQFRAKYPHLFGG